MRKIFVILAIFFSLFGVVFSYDVEISTNKEKIFFGENLKLKLEIKNSEENLQELAISKMNIEENFEIIGTSSSNRFSSQVKNINGKVEEFKEMLTTYTFILSPKKVGEFELGPIVLDDGKEKKETNSVKVQVLENEISNNSSEEETENYYAEKVENLDEKNIFGFFKNLFEFFALILIFLIILVLVFLFILKRKKVEKNNFEENTENQKEILELPPTTDYLLELENEKFIFEFERILKIKLERKIELTTEEENILSEISLALNKLKYSELQVDKKQILELLNNF